MPAAALLALELGDDAKPFLAAGAIALEFERGRDERPRMMLSVRDLMRFWFVVLALATSLAGARAAEVEEEKEAGPGRKARHVVLIVWDGMRPDFVTEEHAPNLWKLAQSGAWFQKHHSAYPSLTAVNAVALATGVYPSESGLLANWEFRPSLDGTKTVRTDSAQTILAGDKKAGGRYLKAPTIAARVREKGGRTALAGTKTASLLQDPEPKADSKSVTLFEGQTLPTTALDEMVKLLGPFPQAKQFPNAAQDRWTTRALTEVLWQEGVPEFSVLWLSEPDYSQHETTPGSKESLAAIQSSDANLGLVLEALEKKKVRERTDVFVVSDHGFSTVERFAESVEAARAAGLEVVTDRAPKRGELRIAGNGGTILIYVGEHDVPTIRRTIDWLQQSEFAGVIFARGGPEGTFALTKVHADLLEGPDIIVAMRWNDSPNAFGVRGVLGANRPKDPAKATHGSLSPFDLHNTLVAAGPDFRRVESNVPSSNYDVPFTIAEILGLVPPADHAGRVLTEALTDPAEPESEVATRILEASRTLPAGEWKQYLRISEVAGTIYTEEGNGEFKARTKSEPSPSRTQP